MLVSSFPGVPVNIVLLSSYGPRGKYARDHKSLLNGIGKEYSFQRCPCQTSRGFWTSSALCWHNTALTVCLACFCRPQLGPLLGQKGVRACQLSSVRLVPEVTCHQWHERLDLSAMLPEDSCLPAFLFHQVFSFVLLEGGYLWHESLRKGVCCVMLEWLRGQRRDPEENGDRLRELIFGLLWHLAGSSAPHSRWLAPVGCGRESGKGGRRR